MARSKSNASDPFSTALRLLTGRDRTEVELSEKLRQLGFSATEISATLAKCRDYNYVNDQKYALERARALFRSGHGVGRKVLLDLRRRGIDEVTASQALEKVSSEFETAQLLRDQLQRRFPNFNYLTAEDKLKRRVVSHFQRRGFPLGEIFAVLKQPQE